MNLILILVLLSKAFAQTTPSENAMNSDQVTPQLLEEKNNLVPEDRVLPNLSLLSLKDHLILKHIEKSKNILNNFAGTKNEVKSVVKDEVKTVQSVEQNPPPLSEVKIIPAPEIPTSHDSYEDKDGIRIFKKNLKFSREKEAQPTITLPSGSSALATLLGGVELASEERSIDARLDYAFLGPNKAVVELTGCVTWIKLKGDYNTERLYGNAYSISCRAPNGKTFEIAIKAHVKDEKDEYLGAKGKLLANGKLAAAALSFLKDGTVAFGDALSHSQTTTTVVGGGLTGNSTSGQNVTGDKESYVLGQTASGAAGKFLNWWVDYYTSLSPTIAVEPGKKIFLSLEGEVQIPEIFFSNSETIKYRLNTQESISYKGASK